MVSNSSNSDDNDDNMKVMIQIALSSFSNVSMSCLKVRKLTVQ